jgi:hypothetical protein
MSVGARIDRVMRAPAAESAVPGGATAVTLALLLLHRAVSGHAPGEGQALLLAAVAAGTGGMARLGVWAWRRLWREGVGEWEHLVHGRGVCQFGAGMAVLVPMLTLAGVSHEGATAADAVLALLRLWTATVCYLPLALWTGFWWGKVLAQVNGVREPGR